MKNYLIVGLICLVAAMAFGVEPVQRKINEVANGGTLRGVEKCMEYGKSALLSQDAIKAACVQSFHQRLYLPDLATGKAGVRIEQAEVSWEGRLENKTTDHVTTWIQIAVIVFDADGKEQKVFAETPIWIDPMGNADLKVALPDLKPEQFEEIDFCDLEDENPKACFGWAITDLMGLTI